MLGYVLLLLGIEAGSVIGTGLIVLNGGINSIIEIGDEGYKINKEFYEKFKNSQIDVEKVHGIKKVFPYIPVVNLFIAWHAIRKAKKNLFEDAKKYDAFIPMSEEEKEKYKELTTKVEKISFITVSDTLNKDEEYVGIIGNRLIVADHGLTSLHYDALYLSNCTLDEVKKLNEATTYSYRLGKVNDEYVAIIGIPNPDSLVSRIQLKSEDYENTYDFESISEEEAESKLFKVYPFMGVDHTLAVTIHNINEYRDIIDKAMEETIDNLVNEDEKKLTLE